MAVTLGDNDDLAANTDINITPFIDVMLVLLIIFMVAAPLSTVDVPVELPVAAAQPAAREGEPVIVTITADLGLQIGDAKITLDQLPFELDIATVLKRDTRIYISADRSVPYGEMMAVMNRMRGAGYLKIGLVGIKDEQAPDAATAPVPEAQE